MAHGKIRKGVEESIRSATESGSLDAELSAAPLAMLRYMADFLDAPDTDGAPPTRYVTPASFMSFCKELGFTPALDEQQPASGRPKAKRKMDKMRGKFQAFDGGKAANG